MDRRWFATVLVGSVLGTIGLLSFGCASEPQVKATADDSPKVESAAASTEPPREPTEPREASELRKPSVPPESSAQPKPVVEVKPAPEQARVKTPAANFASQETWAKHLESATTHYGFDPAQSKRATSIYESYVARSEQLRTAHETALQAATDKGDFAEKGRLLGVYQRRLHHLGEQCIDRIDMIASIEQVQKAEAAGFRSPRYQAIPPDPDVGRPAANFELKRPNGQTVSLESLKGKVVVLKFWGSWCGFCRKAMPSFEKLQQRYKDNPKVAVLGVSCEKGQGSSNALKLMATEGYTFDVLLNGEATAAIYQVKGYPTVYIVGPDGKIIHKQRGYIQDCDKVFGAIIDRALKS